MRGADEEQNGLFSYVSLESRAPVLQVLYSIRSGHLLCEQLDYDLVFRWFLGLSMADRFWDHSTLTKSRDRLIAAGMARKLLRRVGIRARRETPSSWRPS